MLTESPCNFNIHRSSSFTNVSQNGIDSPTDAEKVCILICRNTGCEKVVPGYLTLIFSLGINLFYLLAITSNSRFKHFVNNAHYYYYYYYYYIFNRKDRRT
jgi:hypothetical protein